MDQTQDKFLKKLKYIIPLSKRLHNSVKISNYKRKIIPTRIRIEMYSKIVGTAIKKYNKWIEEEYNRRKKKIL